MLDCGEQLPALLKKSGFTDINTRAEKVRLGSAGGVVGLQAAACRIGAFRGMRDSILADGGYGVVSSRESFDALLDSIQSEWEINECYATYYMITARRPASSFTAPPSSLSIPEIFDFHARHNGHLSFFRYAGETGLHQISYSAVNHAIECAAVFIKSIAGEGDLPVAVLAISGKCGNSVYSYQKLTRLYLDSITFITIMLGFLRAGVKVRTYSFNSLMTTSTDVNFCRLSSSHPVIPHPPHRTSSKRPAHKVFSSVAMKACNSSPRLLSPKISLKSPSDKCQPTINFSTHLRRSHFRYARAMI